MPDSHFDEDPGLDGPDYVALVIEWPEGAASVPQEITDEVTRPTLRTLARERTYRIATAALGSALAIGFVAWRIHRRRA
jgi:hypothetical protein